VAPPRPDDPIERALNRGIDYLIARQSEDGAWRSEFYGLLKDGPSLTPLVVNALRPAGPTHPAQEQVVAAHRKGVNYLAGMARADGTIDEGPGELRQPVYTAALTVTALSAEGQHGAARDAWLKYLRGRQLTEALGWAASDKEYGGWGYCALVPRKPAAGEGAPPLLESNLSATAFALQALRAADVPPDDPALKAALVFVKRCQNYADEPGRRDPAFDDGGFFFIYDDAVRNKAGLAGKDRFGRERFASYGSATADGFSCLLACGVADNDARVGAARRWLVSHFDPANHPGKYAEGREADRNAVYYYYSRSVAPTLPRLSHDQPGRPPAAVMRAKSLADELLRWQREDGSWANDLPSQRENDPLIATAEAVEALETCWSVLNAPAAPPGR
jgi:squalene-hopene/tetraprenyl-beta-curcumene cyclase